MYLYKITNNINNKIYIGITNNYKKRWANHGLEDTVISKAIKKYGKNNFTFEVLLDNIPIEQIDEYEIKYIQKYNSLVPNGYNVAKGGMYNSGGTKSQSGSENSNAHLTYEEAKYIKDHRNEPMYLLYELYVDKITYTAFKKIYHHQTYLNIEPTVPEYPYNAEFTAQYTSNGKLNYEDICNIRKQYAKGIYWEDVYNQYKNL